MIPARGGSKRLPGKNTLMFYGHPLIAYAISLCRRTRLFERIIVSTDDQITADIAHRYGAEVQGRKPEHATDDSPDIDWIHDLFLRLCPEPYGVPYPDYFAIIRPCHPFRTHVGLIEAWREFVQHPTADSIRAVDPLGVNLYKVWVVGEDGLMKPYREGHKHMRGLTVPYHSYPSQFAPQRRLYKQNASLEISKTTNVVKDRTISGKHILPYYSPAFEGFEIHNWGDYAEAHRLVAEEVITLPCIWKEGNEIILDTNKAHP